MNILQFVSFAASIQLDYASKEKDDRIRKNEEMKVKEGGSDMDIYNFNISGIGDSWMIGTDDNTEEEWNFGNAYKLGTKACPEVIKVPSTLTYYDETKPVEVVGQYAFYGCAYYGATTGFIITKQVKVIKRYAFGLGLNIENFLLEDGSALDTIYYEGLQLVGFFVKYNLDLRITLTLPSSLRLVMSQGIVYCNIFKEIIYCGSNYFEYACDLENEISDETVVKVSSRYPADKTIFGREPDRNSLDEVEEHCIKMDQLSFIPDLVDDGCEVIGWGKGTDLWCPYWLDIPEELNGNTVVSIKENAFANCTIKGPITLPSTLKRIGAYAFANCSAKGPITLPSTLKLIGAYAFANLPGVTSIVCESIELEIGEGAFQCLAQEADQPINISLPKNTRMNKNAFASAKIGGVYVI